MRLFYVNGNMYCKVKRGFSLPKLTQALEQSLPMRPGSFAAHYSREIILSLFFYAEDLKQQYEAYYAEEYDSFQRFLYQKALWEEDKIREHFPAPEETILQLYPDRYSYNVDSLFNYEDSGSKIIDQTLEAIDL